MVNFSPCRLSWWWIKIKRAFKGELDLSGMEIEHISGTDGQGKKRKKVNA